MGGYDHHQSGLAEKSGCLSFSFQRSQSRYSMSRGLKSRNIWYSSTWKHLHCHLFSFLLLSCWMWITQWPPHVSDGCVYWYKTVLQKRCTCWLFWKLNTWSLQSSLEFAYDSHATLCWYLPLVWKTLANHFFPGLCMTLLGFSSGQADIGNTVIPGCHWHRAEATRDA